MLMKAAVVRELGKPLVIEKVQVPSPGPDEVLVKIIVTGVCHTDLHAADGNWPIKPIAPFIPGHEGVGIVVALGSGVTHVKEGDAVGIAWLHDACGCCEYCQTGWETLCESQHNSGYSVNGTFAEYAIGASAYIGRLPANVDFAAMAPILCAGVTAYRGIRETEVQSGEWLVVSGISGLGHIAIQYAKAMGLHVVALDVAADKLELAKATGAEIAIDSRRPQAVSEIIRATGGGAHGALVTELSPIDFSQLVQFVRRRGTISLLGLTPGEFTTPIFDVVLKRITLRGSIVGTRKDLAEAIAFAAEGKIKTHIQRRPLEDINDIFGELKAGKIDGRVVIPLSQRFS